MGHLTLMSEDVIAALAHYPSDLRAQLEPCAPVPGWEDYVNGRYHETKQRDSTLLGGGKPVIAAGQPRGMMPASRWKADESETSTAADTGGGGGGDGGGGEEPQGEFRRTTSGHPSRQTADFGPAPEEGEDEDEDGDGPPPQVRVLRTYSSGIREEWNNELIAPGSASQFARYLASEMQHHRFESGSDDDDDDNAGWLARSSTFEVGAPPASARRPLPAHGFDVG
jgi:serine/threonine-protein phosphatase 6 regulatory subunit 3